MARIAGINIPSNQHLEIGLTSIFGIGRSRAREICKALNIPCSKKVKDLNEDKYDALKIAKAKAEYLSRKYRNKIIVTFDTTILFKKKTIYKCVSPKCCKRTLKAFNNKSHDLYTAMIFMINNNLIKSTLTKTKITFNNTRVKDINNYVDKNFKQVSKAVGCYNIEGKGNFFFKDIYGSYFNIIGIDVINFLKTLRSI